MIDGSFSIVINTLNRGHLIGLTLESLRYLNYPRFEVIVVNGPSTDNTQQVLNKFQNEIRLLNCPVANLSVSRNIGIAAANGAFVAFIDDDAIPDPQWLNELLKFYDDESVAGVGGWVFDRDGYSYQSRYLYSSRSGYNMQRSTNPEAIPSYPFAEHFPYITGCNSSFRTQILREVGGFDEEYEYFLDETDVCIRLTDAGYKIRANPRAIVFHKYAASNLRDSSGKFKKFYPIVKNMTYFMLKHAITSKDRLEALNQTEVYKTRMLNYISKRHLVDSDLTDTEKAQQLDEIESAHSVGRNRGQIAQQTRGRVKLFLKKEIGGPHSWRAGPSDKLSIALVSFDFPPGHNGGIARWISEVAESLSAKGHNIHVLTFASDGFNLVEFNGKFWIHRLSASKSTVSTVRSIPLLLSRRNSIFADRWALVVRDELRRLEQYKDFDCVLAPLWAAEGFRLTGSNIRWPLITSLHTTMKTVIENSPQWRGRPLFRKFHIEPIVNAERQILSKSDFILANSRAVVDQIENDYAVKFQGSGIQNRVFTIPHGIDDRAPSFNRKFEETTKLKVLFVGRLERRKGIDTLFKAMIPLLEIFQEAELHIIGDYKIEWAPGKSAKDFFSGQYASTPGFSRIFFHGYQPDSILDEHYKSADVFVAPSRFESFGLMIIEAMCYSLPIISTRAGGIAEIINTGSNGILVEPEDFSALQIELERLMKDSKLRERLGKQARSDYLERFTTAKMASELEEMFYEIRDRNKTKSQRRTGAE